MADRLRIYAFCALFLISSLCLPCTAQSWQTGAIITLQYWNGHGGALIKQVGMTNPEACPRSDYYLLQRVNPNYKEITALLMTSQMAGRSMQIMVAGCEEGFPVIRHVAVTT